MLRRMELARYTRPAVVLHWLVAAFVVVQYPLGWWMQTIPKQPPGQRAEVFNVHKSIGLTLLALMAIRLAWRATHPAPALPPMPAWQARLARTVHALLYVVLVAMPLSGWIGSMASGYPVKYFGVVLPSFLAKNEALKNAMSTVHEALAWTLGVVLALHLAGVIRHALGRDGLWRRMTFSAAPDGSSRAR